MSVHSIELLIDENWFWQYKEEDWREGPMARTDDRAQTNPLAIHDSDRDRCDCRGPNPTVDKAFLNLAVVFVHGLQC
jgi:hypothetical protein